MRIINWFQLSPFSSRLLQNGKKLCRLLISFLYHRLLYARQNYSRSTVATLSTLPVSWYRLQLSKHPTRVAEHVTGIGGISILVRLWGIIWMSPERESVTWENVEPSRRYLAIRQYGCSVYHWICPSKFLAEATVVSKLDWFSYPKTDEWLVEAWVVQGLQLFLKPESRLYLSLPIRNGRGTLSTP